MLYGIDFTFSYDCFAEQYRFFAKFYYFFEITMSSIVTNFLFYFILYLLLGNRKHESVDPDSDLRLSMNKANNIENNTFA